MPEQYETSFQKFLAENIDRSKMASIIYGVSRKAKNSI
jgi:hypothetical protein